MRMHCDPGNTRKGPGMKAYQVVRDPQTNQEIFETPLDGSLMLESPMLNKGSAFTEEERRNLGLQGLLPSHVATMDEQLVSTYENYLQKTSAQERHIFLASLQDRNETLFYRLLSEHITEMLPMIYTPVVGITAQHYSHIYRRPRGLFISYPQREAIEAMLRNAPYADVRAIVVTDGERVLGLGDLGVGGMEISVGKLSLYSLCAGIHPAHTLPIHLDVGTDNQALLDDPLYLGWRHERVRGSEYDSFIEHFVTAVKRVFPEALLQWEDFAKQNARRLLDQYRDQICSFNDDIQGTGAVALAGLLTATAANQFRLRDQRIVILGAGSAATGICEQIVAAMIDEGSSTAEAKAAIWLVDSHGLVHDGRMDLDPFKRVFAQPLERAVDFHLARPSGVTLGDVVRQIRPTILIGAAAQPGAFTESTVRWRARCSLLSRRCVRYRARLRWPSPSRRSEVVWPSQARPWIWSGGSTRQSGRLGTHISGGSRNPRRRAATCSLRQPGISRSAAVCHPKGKADRCQANLVLDMFLTLLWSFTVWLSVIRCQLLALTTDNRVPSGRTDKYIGYHRTTK